MVSRPSSRRSACWPRAASSPSRASAASTWPATRRNDVAVQRLRERKGRVDKPFAVMAANLAVAEALVEIDEAELALLTSRARPIVLLRKRGGRRCRRSWRRGIRPWA